MPPHVSKADPGRSAPAPTVPFVHPFLASLRSAIAGDPNAVADALLGLLRAVDAPRRAALTDAFLDLVADPLAEAIDEALDGLRTVEPLSATSDKARSKFASTEADWLSFWSRHPNAVGAEDARRQFDLFSWTPEFRREFFEGFERWLNSKEWRRGNFFPAVFLWLKKRMFREYPLGWDGRIAVSAAEQSRKKAEARSLPPVVRQALSAIGKPPLPPADIDRRSMAEIYADKLAAGERDPLLEQFVLSTPKEKS